MSYDDYTANEIQTRGDEIYEYQIRPHVERKNYGKFVVIDIETGEYELDDDDLEATKRALAKRPESVLYGLRIGYPATYTLGGHSTKEQG